MKKYFITGLLILLPLVVTLMIFVFLLDLFTAPFLDMVTNFLSGFQKKIPLLDSPDLLRFFARIVILILLCLAITLLGVLGRWFFFKSFLSWTNRLFSKIPLVRSIYNILRDMMQALFTDKEKKAFRRTVLVPFPSDKSYCAGFETGLVPEVCQKAVEKTLIPVFVPTAPHPISGYLILLNKEDAIITKMTKEEVIKFTVSCGVIGPEKTKISL